MAEETEEERTRRLSLSDVRSGWGLITDIFGSLFNWGVPLLIFGGIFLAAAGPISTLLPKDWQEPFTNAVNGIKMYINTTIGKEIFNVPKSAAVAAAQSVTTPESLQQDITKALTAQSLNQDIAQSIARAVVPNQQELTRVLEFAAERNLLTRPGQLMQPENLIAFARSNPATMQRIVNALPAGQAGVNTLMPYMSRVLNGFNQELLGAISQTSGSSQSAEESLKHMLPRVRELLTVLRDNPEHAVWVNSALDKFADPKIAGLLKRFQANPQEFEMFTQNVEAGKPLLEALPPEVRDQLVTQQYDAMKNDPAYGALIAVLEKADPKVVDEFKAITDPSKLQEQALAIITATPARIAALKELTDGQLVEVLSKAGVPLEGDLAIILGHKPTRDAAIDMLGKLAATNSAGNNELGAMLGSLTHQTSLVGRVGVIGAYMQGNTERLGALHDFKLAAETIAGGRGDEAKPAYAMLTGGLGMLVGNAPQATQLASAAAQLPDSLKPVIDGVVTGGTGYLTQLLTNDSDRAFLNQETDGRKNIYRVGDALAAMDASKFAGGAAVLTLLTTKQGEAYPNLDALLQAATTIDNHSGSTVAAAEGLALRPEAERTDADKTLLQTELETDENNQRIIGVLAAAAQGKITRVGDDKGVDTLYRAETFMGPVELSGKNLVAYFNNGQQQGITAISQFLSALDTSKLDAPTAQAIAALKDHVWVDANKNGVIERGEGAANLLYDPEAANKLLATAAAGENQFAGVAGLLGNTAANWLSFGLVAKSVEATDGNHMYAIAEAMGKAGVGQATDTQAADGMNPVRLAMAGVVPAGGGAVLSK